MNARKFIDIGANLTDSMYKGIYNGKVRHICDVKQVLTRAASAGLKKIIITSGCLEDIQNSIHLINQKQISNFLFTTIGYHPTRCLELHSETDPNYYETCLSILIQIYNNNKDKIVAVGEIGLDYERLQFCPSNIQINYFEKQLTLVKKTKLPMFIHCRKAAKDLISILEKHHHELFGGVIHSFDGTLEEAEKFIKFGYYIGLNGCSLKTQENLNVASKIPLEKIMIETDAPWCEIKASHASHKFVKTFFQSKKKEKFELEFMVKGRNEPCNIIQVLEVLDAIRNESFEEIENQIYQNTISLFFNKI